MRYSGNGGKCHGREISDRTDLEEQGTCETPEFMADGDMYAWTLYIITIRFFSIFLRNTNCLRRKRRESHFLSLKYRLENIR